MLTNLIRLMRIWFAFYTYHRYSSTENIRTILPLTDLHFFMAQSRKTVARTRLCWAWPDLGGQRSQPHHNRARDRGWFAFVVGIDIPRVVGKRQRIVKKVRLRRQAIEKEETSTATAKHIGSAGRLPQARRGFEVSAGQHEGRKNYHGLVASTKWAAASTDKCSKRMWARDLLHFPRCYWVECLWCWNMSC